MDIDPASGPEHLAIARASSDLATAMRALAHEQRLMILGLVADGEMSVGEIERILRIPQPAVSQQLARLREDDLVTVRREGRTAYYLTNAEAVGRLLAGLAALTGLQRSVEAPDPRAVVVETPRTLAAPAQPRAGENGAESPIVSA